MLEEGEDTMLALEGGEETMLALDGGIDTMLRWMEGKNQLWRRIEGKMKRIFRLGAVLPLHIVLLVVRSFSLHVLW